jgi:rod shape-determining protein MreC
MPVRSRSPGWSYVNAIPWRALSHRFSFLFFALLALGLLVFGRVHPAPMEGARIHVMDTLAPVLDALSRPIVATQSVMANIRDYVALRAENDKLRADMAQLKQWENAVATLQTENNGLRDLLRYKVEPASSYISARVIADTGGPFVRGLIVTAGKIDGVREGMAAMTGDGLIGRVVEAGDWSSRVLLITDFNSRIPVMIEGSGERAVLAGDNTPEPRLMYLPQDAVLNAGARVVTSGHGGVFPPNLPIGIVREDGPNIYSLATAADLGRINYVRLVDFNLKGGQVNPIATKLQAEAHKH